MTADFQSAIRDIYALHRLALDGRAGLPEADAIRDAADDPWPRLDADEREAVGRFSEWLYQCEPEG